MADERGAAPEVVEVVYAMAEVQHVVRVDLEPGMTAEQAVRRSGLIERYPEIAERPLVLGVFGKAVALEHLLAPGDRVEICRPLPRDPRALRRAAAASGSVVGRRSRSEH